MIALPTTSCSALLPPAQGVAVGPPWDNRGLGAILKGPRGEAWGQHHAPHPLVLDGTVIPSAQFC